MSEDSTLVTAHTEEPQLARPLAERKWRVWAVAAGLMLFVAVFDSWLMPAEFWPGDPFTWREETRSLLDHGWMDLDMTFVLHFSSDPGQYFVGNEKDGKFYSKYGVMNSIISIPPMWYQKWRSGRLPYPGEPPDLWIFNAYYVLLNVMSCGVLFALTGRYTRKLWLRAFYVMAAFYATYFWYYQRSQGSEAYQVLFFLSFVYFMMVYLDGFIKREGRPGAARTAALMAAWIFAAALLFCRVVFGILLPVMGAILLVAALQLPRDKRVGTILRQAAGWIIPPVAIVLLLLWVNYAKFGDPFKTGYHVWKPEDHLPRNNLREWGDGLWGYLFDPNGSMLVHFPLLAFALFAWPAFFRKHRFDALVIGASFAAMVLVLAKTPTWRGEWTYGPRYLVFGLLAASLPFLLFMDWLLEKRQWATWRSYAVGGVLAWAVTYSTYLQYQVIESHFWIYYNISYGMPGTDVRLYDEFTRAFLDHSAGRIASDARRAGDDLDQLLYIKMLRKYGFPADTLNQYKQLIKSQISFQNFYWVQERLAKAAHDTNATRSAGG